MPLELATHPGLGLGGGFDSVKAVPIANAQALQPFSIRPPVCPFERKFDLHVVETTRELQNILNLSVSAEINVVVASAKGTVGVDLKKVENRKSIKVLLRDERINCLYAVDNAEFTPEAAAMFENDYPAFRKKYGDTFVSTVATGGRFYGLLEITQNTEEEYLKAMLELKAKVLGVTVFKLRVEKEFEDLAKAYNANIVVYENNSVTNVGKDLGSFRNRYQNYVTGATCTGAANGLSECVYRLGFFEDYAQLGRFSPAASTELQKLIMAEHALRFRNFSDLRVRLYNVIGDVNGYDFGDPSLSFDDKKRQTQALIDSTEARLRDTLTAYAQCQQEDICVPAEAPTDGELAPELAVERQIPRSVARFPWTCQEVRRHFGLSKDGIARLYWRSDPTMPFDAYCVGMRGEDGPIRMYLPLRITSPATARPAYNFSRSIGTRPGEGNTPKMLTTVFEALHVEVDKGEERLKVLPHQEENREIFAAHVGAGIAMNDGDITMSHVYSPKICADAELPVMANLNLLGTPFRIQAANVFRVSTDNGFNVSTEDDNMHRAVTVSADQKQADFRVHWPGLAAGASRPSCQWTTVRGALYLEYAR